MMVTLCVGYSVQLKRTGRHVGHDVSQRLDTVRNLGISGGWPLRYRVTQASLIEPDS